MHFTRRTLVIGLCWLAVGCNRPIPNVADLNGCYFAKEPNPIFEIREAKLLAPRVHIERRDRIQIHRIPRSFRFHRESE